MIDLSNVPNELKQRGLFCLWKYSTRTNANGEKYRTKVPMDPNTGNYGDSTNPEKFADLETTLAHIDAYDGIGVGIFGDIAGVDIDHCMTDGKLSELAQDVLESIGGGYMEFSPSGDGIHVLFSAPGISERYTRDEYERHYRKNRRDIGLEIYIAGTTDRFLTLTGRGRSYGEFDKDRTEQIQSVLDRYMKLPEKSEPTTKNRKVTPLDVSDEELLAFARGENPLPGGNYAANAEKFSQLWDGNMTGYASPSEAVAALLFMLAFWTQRDEARMDAMFRNSRLYDNPHVAEKWDSKRGSTTWGAKEISKAASKTTDVYSPSQYQSVHIGRPGGNTFAEDESTARASSHEEQNNTSNAGDAESAKHDEQEPAGDDQDSPDDDGPQKSPVDLFNDFMERIQTEDYKPLKTSMTALDNLLGGGVMRQSIVILTAQPGAGKTALCSQIAEQMARDGQDVIYLNLEMSREYMFARSLSRIIAGYDYRLTATQILRGYEWTDDDRDMVEAAAESYRTTIAPHMHYNPNNCDCYLENIVATLTKYGQKAKSEGRMAPPVILDYLHLVAMKRRADAQEIVKETISVLKEYAIIYDTFVIAISATNRQSNMRGKQTQNSARDSSSIEYTADTMLGLNFAAFVDGEKKVGVDGKERKYSPENPDDMDELYQQKPRRMVIQVLKNRMTEPGGKLYLNFDAAQSRFRPSRRVR